jgi:cystathionine beta-lyase
VAGLTGVGEEVLTMTPIYPPFLGAIADQGRRTRQVPLVQGERGEQGVGGWKIDWSAMEAAVTPATRLLMLCHPHNPTGRIWSVEELSQLAAFAQRHRLWVVSDELHADLSLEGGFVPFVSVASPEVRMRTVTVTGPCKTYNTAGVGIGAMISHNPEIVARIKKVGGGLLGHAGTLSVTMWRTALQDDGEWLASVLGYLRRNRELVATFVRERLPGVVFHPPQATYLAWLDYRGHRKAAEIQQYLLAEGKVALNDGPMFGTGYQGFVRLNFATSAAILKEALERMARVH